MAVRIQYAEGFPTLLPKMPRLSRMLSTLGPPKIIKRFGRKICMEWEPIYPGVPIPTYDLDDPYWGEKPRPILSIEFVHSPLWD